MRCTYYIVHVLRNVPGVVWFGVQPTGENPIGMKLYRLLHKLAGNQISLKVPSRLSRHGH